MKTRSYLTVLTLPALLFACASAEPVKHHTQKVKTGDTIQTQFVANEQDAQAATEISFKPGSTEIRPDEWKKIEAAAVKARGYGKIEEIKIVSWADEEYPSVYTKKLSGQQIDLAERRNTELAKRLNAEFAHVKIDQHNMASRPNAIQGMFQTSDYRLKRSLEEAGIPNTDTSVKMPAQAGKALVMILVDDKAKTKKP